MRYARDYQQAISVVITTKAMWLQSKHDGANLVTPVNIGLTAATTGTGFTNTPLQRSRFWRPAAVARKQLCLACGLMSNTALGFLFADLRLDTEGSLKSSSAARSGEVYSCGRTSSKGHTFARAWRPTRISPGQSDVNFIAPLPNSPVVAQMNTSSSWQSALAIFHLCASAP